MSHGWSANDLDYWMEKAFNLASLSARNEETPVGAILVNGGNVLGVGFNQREATQQVTSHAEIMAISQYSKHFFNFRLPPGSALFVTKEPCLMCATALLQARLTHLWYGCSDSKGMGIEKLRPWIEAGEFGHRLETLEGGILSDRSSDLFRSFFKRRRQKEFVLPGFSSVFTTGEFDFNAGKLKGKKV